MPEDKQNSWKGAMRPRKKSTGGRRVAKKELDGEGKGNQMTLAAVVLPSQQSSGGGS